jgi:hypothetical protein
MPIRSLTASRNKGLWADLGVSLSPEEIDQNQRDMWRNFPREHI